MEDYGRYIRSWALLDGTALAGVLVAGLFAFVSPSMASRGSCQADELKKLTADDAYSYDKFGHSVDLDGETMVIGAYGDENDTGAAYVLTGSGARW